MNLFPGTTTGCLIRLNDPIGFLIDKQLYIRTITPSIHILNTRIVPMALKSNSRPFRKRYPKCFLINPILQLWKAIGVHRTRTQTLLIPHPIQINRIPLAIRLCQHPIDPATCLPVEIMKIIPYISLRELLFIIVIEAGNTPAGLAIPIGTINFRIQRRMSLYFLITIGITYHNRFLLIPFRRITIAIQYQTRLYIIPLLYLLKRIRRQIFITFIGQPIVRFPNNHRRMIAECNNRITVVLPFVSLGRFVFQGPFIVSTVYNQQNAIHITSLKSFGKRRLMPYAERISSTLGNIRDVLPTQSCRNGGSQTRINVSVTKSPQNTFFTVDIAMIFIPGNFTYTEFLTFTIHLFTVYIHFILHGVQIWSARTADRIP